MIDTVTKSLYKSVGGGSVILIFSMHKSINNN